MTYLAQGWKSERHWRMVRVRRLAERDRIAGGYQ
jgi:hypothetical protein